MSRFSRGIRIGLAGAGIFLGGHAVVVAAVDPASPMNGEWSFRVLLDGAPIGQHRFSVRTEGDERDVISEASFAVKVLGFTVYRYQHHDAEHWRGNCLATLSSSTDDDGKTMSVEAAAGKPPIEGCVMSFAYWNPAIRTQSRLLNAQTGKLEEVRIEPLAGAAIDVHGKPCAATGFRIHGAGQPIDVWYSAEGRWIGLDSVVRGGRKLSYRLP